MSIHRFTIDIDFKDETDFADPATWDTPTLISFLHHHTPSVFGVAGIVAHETVNELAWGDYEPDPIA